jgi:rhodanese-related sulfurtransferase
MFGSNRTVNDITPEEVRERLASAERLQIVDVREPFEFAQERVAESILIPLGELTRRVGELSREAPVVMCRSGNRSKVGVSLLQRAGFKEVYNLEGGILRWARAGLPVDRGR